MTGAHRLAAAPSPSARDDCLALLAALLAYPPGGVGGTALFLLDGGGPPLPEAVGAEVERRLRGAAPAWHRLLRGDAGEFIVIAQGLVDGGAVLAAAARLVHAFDDALQTAAVSMAGDVAIGIAFSPEHGKRAKPLLEAAEASLRESRAATRLGRGVP